MRTQLKLWDINQPVPARIDDPNHGHGRIYDGEHCVEINGETSKWSVVGCQASRFGICQKPASAHKNNLPVPNGCGPDWVTFLDPETKSTYCYTIMRQNMTYYTSRETLCDSSRFVTIRNRYEQEFIRTQLIDKLNDSGDVWLGITSSPDTYRINATTVRTLKIEGTDDEGNKYQISYNNWDANQLNGSSRSCAYMTLPSGLWRLGDCNRSKYAVCKKLKSGDPYVHKQAPQPANAGFICPPGWLSVEHEGKLSKCLYPSAINYGMQKNQQQPIDPIGRMASYSEAKKYCKQINPNKTITLASFESKGELELIPTALKDFIHENRYRRRFFRWIGNVVQCRPINRYTCKHQKANKKCNHL